LQDQLERRACPDSNKNENGVSKSATWDFLHTERKKGYKEISVELSGYLLLNREHDTIQQT